MIHGPTHPKSIHGNNRDEDGPMGNVRESTVTSQKLGELGGSKGGTDCHVHEKEKVGMVRATEKKR